MVPYPVTLTQGGDDQSKQLRLANDSDSESESGSLGRSTQMTGPMSSPLSSHYGRPDSSAALLGVPNVGLAPATSLAVSGSSASVYSVITTVEEVGHR